jgi:hypothetical protein
MKTGEGHAVFSIVFPKSLKGKPPKSRAKSGKSVANDLPRVENRS